MRLRDAVAANASAVSSLQRQHDDIVAASESSNADDEHDPEGATIAFERAQVAALLQQARRTGTELERALERLQHGRYGNCERCGEPIGVERLAARPSASTCISCASV